MEIISRKKVILVTGSNGQLGKELRKFASTQDDYEFLFTTRDTMDITSAEEVNLIFNKFKPDFCINCAAYTNVDKAEEEEELAFCINKEGVEILAKASSDNHTKLIHISTDYVYNSIDDRPLKEDDPCHPEGVYARSKRAGELILEKSNCNWVGIRVSWLYSSFNHNFVKTMIRLGSSRSNINVVDDQIGCPTYSFDLVDCLMTIIRTDPTKTNRQFFNFSNSGKISWAIFAREIFTLCQFECEVGNISTAEYNAAAPRPLWSVLSLDKASTILGIEGRDWKESLKECLSLINTTLT